MRRWMTLFVSLCLLCAALPLHVSAQQLTLTTDKEQYEDADTITVSYSGTDNKDWVGIYPDGAIPGTTNAIVWSYAVGSGKLPFSAGSLGGAGVYTVYLCDNDGYAVLASVNIVVADDDRTDYGVKNAEVSVTMTNGKSETAVTVQPSSDKSLTYSLWWSCEGERLEGYTALKTLTHEGSAAFKVALNDCLFMPDEADGIEIAVFEGRSTSCFAAVDEALKLPKTERLYEFQVLTDTHISEDSPQRTANLTAALREIAAVSPDSEAVFFVGDNTDRGTDAQYTLLLDTIENAGVALPPLWFAMGNHDTVYGGAYQQQVDRFTRYLGMDGVYYAARIGDTRFIVLGSDVQVGEGELNDVQLDWLRQQLCDTDPEKPVFIFLHQPLKDTVSGTLTSLDADVQDWYGLPATGDALRDVLKNHPNAILFSGHTHWSLDMTQPLLYGGGEDATFANAASVGYLWSDADEAIGGSQGYYVEVYKDYVLLRGREFSKDSWCAAAQFMIPLNGGTGDVFDERDGVSVWFVAVVVAGALLAIAAAVLIRRKC